MATVIENPILNSPFEEPRRHFAFDEDGITDIGGAAFQAANPTGGAPTGGATFQVANPTGGATFQVANPALRPVFRPYEVLASTRAVDFNTVRPTWATSEKCHISHVVADTGSWEQRMPQTLEEMPEVLRYVKNDRQPGFTIPYTIMAKSATTNPTSSPGSTMAAAGMIP
jgi:hypothetical protein